MAEVIEVQNVVSRELNKKDEGKTFEVLVEGDSKKSDKDFKGRNTQNKMIIFAKKEGVNIGDYVQVKVHDSNQATLFGSIVK